MKAKEENETVSLKLNFQKTEIMTSCPITSWQIIEETMERVTDFIFLGSKIIADDGCSHEIKRLLLLGRKAKTKLDSILKIRDNTLPAKVHLLKGMVFPLVIYGCALDHNETWASKNWCFWPVVLEKTLESPSRTFLKIFHKEIQPVNPKWSQSWLFIRRTDAEAETPIQCPPDVKNCLIGEKPWCWERLKVGGEGDGKDWDGWMALPTRCTWVWVSSGYWW